MIPHLNINVSLSVTQMCPTTGGVCTSGSVAEVLACCVVLVCILPQAESEKAEFSCLYIWI